MTVWVVLSTAINGYVQAVYSSEALARQHVEGDGLAEPYEGRN